jgi:type III restriction enzyme
MMQFRFDANQEFQLAAIEAVAKLFEGQPPIKPNLEFKLGFAAIGNRLDLDDAALLKNVRAVQKDASLPADKELQHLDGEAETVEGNQPVRFYNFSVEMETGTGKTYVYIRTALELFQRYGFRKYIVVVPSVAIREGVLKTFQMTEKHLKEHYGNLSYRYYVYDSENLSQVRQFALSPNVEFMVMTIDSFNKASNVIRQTTDRLQGETPVHLVQAARPILILDEPQNMESELRIQALATLNPLFALRYSATHRNPYNLVHRLTPFEAYRQRLVKRIEVAGVEKVDDANQVFIRLEGVRSEKKTLTARVAIHQLMKTGQVKEKVVTVRPGDKLEDKAGRPEYAGFAVEELDAGEGLVRFANGVVVKVGESRGADREAVFDEQIRYTVEEHFRKQAKLKDANIKVLSLFFIDRVDNYAREDGVIRLLFDKAFNDLKRKYSEWQAAEPDKLRAAYFAARRTREGDVVLEDSSSGEAEKDKEAYDLIMKDKERLLSFDEPTCFIFSHSALREGWDNPNVFQICTLNQTASETKKRQEVGRGVRLCVDQTGDRVRDDKVNVLTVVANESYEKYVERYQAEVVEELGADGAPPVPVNARTRKTVHLRKAYTLKPEFVELWKRIARKTRYCVKIDTPKLIADVVKELDTAVIKKPHIRVEKGKWVVGPTDEFKAEKVGEKLAEYEGEPRLLPNLVEVMADLMGRTTPPMRLTRGTLLEVFQRTKNQQGAIDNPHEFATIAVQIIKRKLAEQMIDGIQYEKLNEWFEMSQFDADFESWQDYLAPSRRADGKAGASVYDQVPYESEIEKEFVEGLEKRDDVKLYVKLPAWFVVNTPIGTYNPDWAIVLEPRDEFGKPTGEQKLYLVRETKDTTDRSKLRPDERAKVECGERHFRDALGVDYRVVSDANKLN